MPLITAAIGLRTAAIEHEVDARWTMAYSASLGDEDAIYLDTTRDDGIVAHPLFAVCPEWPVALASRELLRERGLNAAEYLRALHATHDSHIVRLIRPGDRLRTTATVVAMEMRRPGAYVTSCLDTHDQAGELVCRTFHGMLYRDVEVMSVNKAPTADLATGIEVPSTPYEMEPPDAAVDEQFSLAVGTGLAHVYTECARIFNPVHTDEAVARAAGLPHIILHGSATLALAVSAIVRARADGDPHRVRRVCGQFRGYVLMPAELTLVCFSTQTLDGATVIPFEVRNAAGEAVFSRASITLAAAG